MSHHSRLLIFILLLVNLVAVAEDLIPFENKSLGLWGYRKQAI